MHNNCSEKFWSGRAARSIIRGLLAALAVLAVSGIASAQDKQEKKDEIVFDLLQNPATSSTITPDVGNSLFLATHGVGTQGYVCLPTSTGVSWTVNNARPADHNPLPQPRRKSQPHRTEPATLRRRDVAEFLRQQPGLGTKEEFHYCRNRSELPEWRRD